MHLPRSAAAPSNDNFANARVVDSVPFIDSVIMAEATIEPGEPFPIPGGFDQTVWYRLTPAATGAYRTSVSGSVSNSGSLAVYRQTGTGFGGLSFINAAGLGGDLVFTADAGAS